jgi:hypothetical protein
MHDMQVCFSRVGSLAHLRDIDTLRSRGVALPDCYLFPEVSNSWWCGVSRGSTLISGFVVERTFSRLIPMASVLRIARVGRALHEPILSLIEPILTALSARFALVLRVDVALFDEDGERRQQFEAALTSAGMQIGASRSYTRTLRVDLAGSEEELFARLSSSTRRNVRAAERAALTTVPIEDEQLFPTMRRLYSATFQRTGADPPPIDFGRILESVHYGQSALFGVFAGHQTGDPHALVAFAWVRSNGDHASYDVAASARRQDLGRTPLSYPLLWRCLTWARERKLSWMDLGGIPGANVPSGSPLHAIAAFKRGFSCQELDVASEFRIEPNRTLAAVARTVRQFVR